MDPKSAPRSLIANAEAKGTEESKDSSSTSPPVVTATASKASAAPAVEFDEHIPQPRVQGRYQSEEAVQQAIQEQVAPAQAPIESAEVSPALSAAQRVERSEDTKQHNMVMIRPRIKMPRFRYGDKWYHLEAGKKTLVPRHLADVLEQKGAL